ncbi:sigma-70 family RNA polymerase sigma factor [Galbibacter sp. EGI 63066]|uniref:RNA polymerase sigma factor n=1 Tax=Galbibacter sp. EGI 63066 TaxID=2993559 RepID=UPI0022495577|nr:sigma-70 family RNA polymerase sigma factor [Galbibacter sp. EGI 63066]MCX2681331.1 sigma-70 family RNA polymerase sigma factor [Galbibacter sp. EGI 63066]
MDLKARFTKVIKENKGLIFKVTTLYTDGEQDRKDLYQEIVYQLWKSFDSFKEQSKLSTWMYRVALNTAIYHLKQTKKRIQTVPIDFKTDRFDETKDKVEEERIKLLYEHIQRLNLLERGIILLYLEGKSYEEIASIVGITTTNVGTKISRIKKKLKSEMSSSKN